MNFEFREVPPPKEAPVDQIAETMGLIAGLRAQKEQEMFRCAHCHQPQRPPAWLVWVPDSVVATDPAWAIIEACRRNAYNGSGSGWCLDCAKALGKPVVSRVRGLLGFWRDLTSNI